MTVYETYVHTVQHFVSLCGIAYQYTWLCTCSPPDLIVIMQISRFAVVEYRHGLKSTLKCISAGLGHELKGFAANGLDLGVLVSCHFISPLPRSAEANQPNSSWAWTSVSLLLITQH